MDESWHEEVSQLKEDWEFPAKEITDPIELLEVFVGFLEQTKRRRALANEDLSELESIRDRHVADFSRRPAEERDKVFERRVLKKDGDAIKAKLNDLHEINKDIDDWDGRIKRLRAEIASLKEKEKAQKRPKEGTSGADAGEPLAKREKKSLSASETSKLQVLAKKLRDVDSIKALRGIMDECASLAKGEDERSGSEKGHDESDLSLEDLPDGADVRGVSILDELTSYSDDEKNKLLLSKYPLSSLNTSLVFIIHLIQTSRKQHHLCQG